MKNGSAVGVMNKEIKKLWVTALRSGEYKQGTKHLRTANQHGTRYCCLGVLSDLAVKAKACTVKEAFTSPLELLTPSVMKWAGLKTENPKITKKYRLSAYNDGNDGCKQHSFAEIADLIEKKL